MHMLQTKRLVGKIVAKTLAGRAASSSRLIALRASVYVHNLYVARCSFACHHRRHQAINTLHAIHDRISIRNRHEHQQRRSI